jgi:hypothetical protein
LKKLIEEGKEPLSEVLNEDSLLKELSYKIPVNELDKKVTLSYDVYTTNQYQFLVWVDGIKIDQGEGETSIKIYDTINKKIVLEDNKLVSNGNYYGSLFCSS